MLVFSYVSGVLDSEKIWLFAIPGVFYPVLFLINCFFIIAWLLTKPKWALISAFAILLGFSHISTFISFNTEETGLDSQDFKVVSFNIKNASSAYSRDKTKRKAKKKALRSFLKDFDDTDIVGFQEVAGYANDILDLHFSKWYKHKEKVSSPTIYSKHKIVDKGIVDFNTVTNGCIWADIVVRFDTVRVYNVHLQSNKITEEAEHVMTDANLQESKTWNSIRGILSSYKKYNQKRSKKIKQVRKHMDSSPYPILLLGDLNDTPQSFIYQFINKELKDSFCQKGSGVGNTYAGRIPFLRIDYIFADNSFDFKSHKVIRKRHSDHFPIVATLSLAKKQED